MSTGGGVTFGGKQVTPVPGPSRAGHTGHAGHWVKASGREGRQLGAGWSAGVEVGAAQVLSLATSIWTMTLCFTMDRKSSSQQWSGAPLALSLQRAGFLGGLWVRVPLWSPRGDGEGDLSQALGGFRGVTGNFRGLSPGVPTGRCPALEEVVKSLQARWVLRQELAGVTAVTRVLLPRPSPRSLLCAAEATLSHAEPCSLPGAAALPPPP